MLGFHRLELNTAPPAEGKHDETVKEKKKKSGCDGDDGGGHDRSYFLHLIVSDGYKY